MKKSKLLYIISIVICVILFIGLASICQAYTWHTYNGHEYAVTNAWESWVDAESEAVAQGGHLVTINDAAENYWVAETFKENYVEGYDFNTPSAAAVYIGYYLNPTTNEWGWISGETPAYTNLYYDWNTWNPGPHAYLHTNNHPFPAVWNHAAWHTEPPPQDPRYGYMKGIIERPASTVSDFVTANATGTGAGMVQSNVGGLNYTYPESATGTTSAIDHLSTVILTATGSTGSTVAWTTCTGAADGNGTNQATCTFTGLDGNKTAEATFTLNTYNLAVTPSGTGSGNVTGNGLNCFWSGSSSGTCSVSLDYNTAVNLTALPSSGSTFSGWGGGIPLP
jgi:hypothetical protein